MIAKVLFPMAVWPVLLLVAACGGGGGGGSTSAASQASGPVYSLSGRVAIVDALAADFDTADPDAPADLPNNPPQPEQLPGSGWPQQLEENPISVAGYASQVGDVDDYYRLELRAGQLLLLEISEPARGDLDLYLYDDDGLRILDASLGTSSREEIRILFDREYVINVSAFSGRSGYVLTVQDQISAASLANPTLGSDFVAGELLVEIEGVIEAASLGQGRLQRRRLQRRNLEINELKSRGMESAKRLHLQDSMAGKYDTLLQLKAISRESGVRRVQPNYLLRASAVPDDPNYYKQWHFPIIDLPSAWDMTIGDRPGREVIVAVLDTGILAGHPDLEGQLVAGYDFVANPDVAMDGDGIDSDPDDPGDESEDPSVISSFHGTHVAGTIAALSNNNLGVAGIAWRAKVMPIRVLGRGSSGTVYDVLQGVRYAAGLPNDSGRVPEQAADIINLSLSGSISSNLAIEAYADARAAGAILVAAGGNMGNSQPVYPAGYEGVVGVGAVGATKQRLSYSSTGEAIDLMAPGGLEFQDADWNFLPDVIYSTQGNLDPQQKKTGYSYGYKSGTSMSAAHVAGVIALMEAVDPQGDLTPTEFDQLLLAGELTEDLGVAGPDNLYGHGLINAAMAVVAAAGAAITPSPILDVLPRSLDLGVQLDQAEITLRNAGAGTLTVESVSSTVDWIDLQAPLEPGGLGVYLLTLDRSQLAAGDHMARVDIESTAGSYSLIVQLQQSSAEQPVGRSAGTLHVYLLEVTGNSETRRAEVVASTSDGAYSFNIGNVAGGRSYRIVASTDHDNDGEICDEGEACASSSTIESLSESQSGMELTLEL